MAYDDPDPELSVYQWRLCEIIEALNKRRSLTAAGLLQMALLELELIRQGLEEADWRALAQEQDGSHVTGATPQAPLCYRGIYERLRLEFKAA